MTNSDPTRPDPTRPQDPGPAARRSGGSEVDGTTRARAGATGAAGRLAQHVGPGHRLELLDPTTLRCHTCQRTTVLPLGAGSTSEPPTAALHPRTADETCPLHPGEWAGTCRCCAADQLVEADAVKPLWPRQPSCSPDAARAARNQLAAALARRPKPADDRADA